MNFNETFKLQKQYKKDYSLRTKDISDFGQELSTFKRSEWNIKALSNIHHQFHIEYEQYIRDNVYFFGCPFNIYKETYKDRLWSYTKFDYADATEFDFIEEELITGIYQHHYPLYDKGTVKQIYYSLKRRLEFLKERMETLGYNISVNIDEGNVEIFEINKLNNTEKSNNQDIPLIDNSDNSITDKIIYLYELGVLDYLKDKEPFNLSTNALANVISSFTGEKSTTIQSYLNPINNPSISQKNNPLDKRKNVEKVKLNLSNLGVKQ